MENSFETIVTKVYDDGVYEGNFVDGKCTGKGKLIRKSDAIYENEVYEGDFVNGKFNGKGKLTRTYYHGEEYDSDEVYEGNFVDGKFMC